jgi:hypothetical protein
MPATLAVAAAAAIALSGQVDTLVTVRPGTELQVANFAGEVRVLGWNRNAVRIQTEAPGRQVVVLKHEDGVLLVKAYSKRTAQQSMDLEFMVPSWMDLDISGIHTDVGISGTKGKVRVETVHGDIVVSGGRGQIVLNAVNQDIHLTDASGTVVSETVNGDLVLQRIASDSVDVSTVNGEIYYEGTIKDKGVYRLTSHNGDIAFAMPKGANAVVNVSTFAGEFSSEFPVTLTETKPGRRFCFTMGTGSAKVELESFQGTIEIFRPGSRHPGHDDGDEEDGGSEGNVNREDK